MTWLTAECFSCSSRLLLQQFWWVSPPPPPSGKGRGQDPVVHPGKTRAVGGGRGAWILISLTLFLLRPSAVSWVAHFYWAQIYRTVKTSQVLPWVLKITEARSVAKEWQSERTQHLGRLPGPRIYSYTPSQQTPLCLTSEFFWPRSWVVCWIGSACNGLLRLKKTLLHIRRPPKCSHWRSLMLLNTILFGRCPRPSLTQT